MLKFRKMQNFTVSLFITLANNKHFFFRNFSNPSYSLERKRVLNTMLPSDFPETTQSSRNCMLKFRKLQILAIFMKLMIYIYISTRKIIIPQMHTNDKLSPTHNSLKLHCLCRKNIHFS